MSELGDVLAIRVALSGMETVIRGVRNLAGEFTGVNETIKAIRPTAMLLAADFALIFASVREASKDESMQLMLEGLTHNSGLAAAQMREIRALSEQGIFNKDELFASLKLFDETKTSLKDNLHLAEELALRMGGDGKLEQATRIITALAGGGMARIGQALRQAGLTVDELRNAGLNISQTYQIKGTPQQALAALKETLGKDDLFAKMGDSFGARLKGLIADVKDFLRSIGQSLLPILGPLLVGFGGILKIVTALNDMTHGWAGMFIIGGVMLTGIGRMFELLKGVAAFEKLAAFWAGIREVIYGGGILTALKGMIVWLKESLVQQIAIAYYAAVAAASVGNFVPIALFGAGVALTGGALYAGGRSLFGGNGDEKQSEPPAEKPWRRSDAERYSQRQRARAWA